MRNLLTVVLLSLMIYGCTESSNPVNPLQSTFPMWPMPGFNSGNTSSPYAPDAVMNPVINGALSWSYTFPAGGLSDGSTFCVDSKGFIYYIHQLYPLGALYKFSPDGNMVWKKDSLIHWNYAAISLNADESRLYFTAFKPNTGDRLFCLDSAGKQIWDLDSALVIKPAIGKDETVYAFRLGGLTAISSDGRVLWTNSSVKGFDSENTYIALDRDDNIYTYSNPSKVVKVSKYGSIVWQFTVSQISRGLVIDGFGNVYFTGYTDFKLYCINQSGQVKWTKPNVNNFSSPVITSNNRIVVSSQAYIISYDTSGTEQWRCQSFTNLLGAEGLLLDDANNSYYIGDGSGGILAASVSSTGVKRWEVNTNLFGSLPPPVLLPQGKLLVAPKRAGKIQTVN
jgi:hypothetical protein